jgi:hypothetical protein
MRELGIRNLDKASAFIHPSECNYKKMNLALNDLIPNYKFPNPHSGINIDPIPIHIKNSELLCVLTF